MNSAFVSSDELWRSRKALLLDLHNSSDDTQPHPIIVNHYFCDLHFQTFHTPSESFALPYKHRLEHNITARYIRVIVKDWVGRPSIRLELYGCEGIKILVILNK